MYRGIVEYPKQGFFSNIGNTVRSILRSAIQTAPNTLILNRLNAVFWLENRRNRVFLETCFSISHFCNSTQIPVFQTANPGHYQAPIRTGNLRSAYQITSPNPNWSPSSHNLKSGYIPAPVCQSGDLISGSRRKCVHADRKYWYKRLFSGNTCFNQDLPLLNSGLARSLLPEGSSMVIMTAGPLLSKVWCHVWECRKNPGGFVGVHCFGIVEPQIVPGYSIFNEERFTGFIDTGKNESKKSKHISQKVQVRRPWF